MKQRVQFNRNELSGSFGDIGTDFPLLVGMILAAKLDVTSVMVMFGLMQILTGLVYGLPMPVQPLKAMAVLVITQGIAAPVLFGGGLAIGLVMLVLSMTGALNWLARAIPVCVVRGIQFGLGLSLASLALKEYVPSLGGSGFVLAFLCFVLMVMLLGNRRLPPGALVIGLGVVYALIFRVNAATVWEGVGFALPQFQVPKFSDIVTGFFILSLPQLPLSISNSVIATQRTVQDFFPERKISISRIGLTYALLNLVVPFFQGVPLCHGCGGLAGHYALGARTGGSVVIYGSIYVLIGLFFSSVFGQILEFFPKPVLGVILLFEALTLLLFVRDQAGQRRYFAISLLVALIVLTLPHGYLLGLAVGTALYYGQRNFLSDSPSSP